MSEAQVLGVVGLAMIMFAAWKFSARPSTWLEPETEPEQVRVVKLSSRCLMCDGEKEHEDDDYCNACAVEADEEDE